jgi:hypothetical protein
LHRFPTAAQFFRGVDDFRVPEKRQDDEHLYAIFESVSHQYKGPSLNKVMRCAKAPDPRIATALKF